MRLTEAPAAKFAGVLIVSNVARRDTSALSIPEVMGTRSCNFLIIAAARADSPPRRRCEIGGLVRVREEHQID